MRFATFLSALLVSLTVLEAGAMDPHCERGGLLGEVVAPAPFEMTEGELSYRSQRLGDELKIMRRFKAPKDKNAPTVIFLNGLTKGFKYWDQVLNEFKKMKELAPWIEEAGIVQLDMLEQGHTRQLNELEKGPTDFRLQSEAIDQVLKEYKKRYGLKKFKDVVVIAHSYGTTAAVGRAKTLREQSTGRVHLILNNPYVDQLDAETLKAELNKLIPPIPFVREWMTACNNLTVDYMKLMQTTACALPAAWWWADMAVRNGVRSALTHNGQEVPEDVIQSAQSVTMGLKGFYMDDALRNLPQGVHVDVIGMKQDTLIPLDAVRKLFDFIPQVNRGLLIEADGPHNTVEEMPEELARIFARLLKP